VSPVATAIFGIPAASFYENPRLFVDRIHPDDRDHVLFAREEVRYERGLNEEFRIRRENGEIRWIRLRSFPVYSETGEVYRLAGIAADITEYKKAREEAEKQQQQLIQADKLASIGMMVSGVAHEINNPNNLIMLNADVMQALWPDVQRVLNEGPMSDSTKIGGLPGKRAVEKFGSMIQGIGGGAVRIKRIVQNLKDFARIDDGDVGGLLDPNEVVDSAMSIIHNMLKNASNRVTVHKDENVPRVFGNFQKLEQVAINLLTNACQALENPDQGITIRVFLDWDQKRVVIEVADEGGGIAPEYRNRILDPFFTTKKGQGGTGLGLSVSYGIMREHHGAIEFAPNHPTGTVARMWLPIHADDESGSEFGGTDDSNE
jgi:PAS domain S-box-containing protein